MSLIGIDIQYPLDLFLPTNNTNMQKDIFFSTYEDFDKSVVIEIIDIYLDEYQSKLEELLFLINSGDFDAVKKVAHSIKGSNSVFYDSTSTESAFKIEHFDLRDIEKLKDLHSVLRQNMETLADELKSIKKSLL